MREDIRIEAAAPKWSRRRFAEAAVAAILACAFLAVLQFDVPDRLYDVDGYFHLKVAQLIGERGPLESFPWTEMSVWKERFFDKDYLYHVLLIPFSSGGSLLGPKIVVVLSGVLLTLALFALLVENGVACPLPWIALFFCAGHPYWARMELLRPLVMGSILAMLLALAMVKRRYLLVILISAVYALTHSGHWVAPVFALFYVAARAIDAGERDARMILCAVGGIALGWVIHPNFPANVWGTYIQNVVILAAAWSPTVDLNFGVELLPLSTKGFLLGHLAVMFACFAAIAVSYIRPAKLSTAGLLFFFLSAFFLGATMLSRRFSECWIPFTIVYLALALEAPAREVFSKLGRGRRAAIAVGLACGLIAFFMKGFGETRGALRAATFPSLAQHARVQSAIAKEDEVIFTCDWATPEVLFFHNDRNRYLVMLDPQFMYRENADRWRLWDALSRGRIAEPPSQVLAEALKLRVGFCPLQAREFLARVRGDPRMEIVYEDDAGCTFRVKE